MSSTPFFCQASVATTLQPCCNATSVQMGTYQCSFPNGDGIHACLTAVTAATNGTLGVACSSQGGNANYATSSKKTAWSLKALVLLFAMSLLSLASASPVSSSSPSLPVKLLEKRDTKCTGFTVQSQTNTYSASVKVSDILNCKNSGAPCMIAVGGQKGAPHMSSYTLSDGSVVSGVKAATFGIDFTDSATSVPQNYYSVPPNQQGYLTAYSQAVLFNGTFTGCSSGGDKPGEALVLKKGGVLYQVIPTNG